MIRVFTNPFLLDIVSVCVKAPDDEKAQLEALTGEPYTLDGAAVGNFISVGPKWVIKHAENEYDFEAGKATTLVVGGFNPQRPGVWRDFLLTTPEAWERHWFPITRICRRIMDAMFISGQAHRLECIVPAARVQSRPELARWYEVLGYHEEGVRYGYCANGSDALAFARVKHGHR
jgi:hypothetical protein